MKIDIQRYMKPKAKAPSHELAASVNEIIALVGTSKQYDYGYWLRKVKTSRMSFCEVLGVLKEARDLPGKYNQGGFITNKLCRKKTLQK
jgi:hypothetical protein